MEEFREIYQNKSTIITRFKKNYSEYEERFNSVISILHSGLSEIEFDDFMKMDIRTGTILEAEKVAKTKKLLKLVVDTGIDKRTVVSGIAEYYDAEKIVGKKVSILVNLAPRKLRGVESQGMILMAEDTDGKLCFVSPVDDVQNGSEIK